MIIWRGKGILVLFIAILGLLVGAPIAMLAQSIGIPGVTQATSPIYGMSAGMLVAAVGNFYFARWLGDPAKARTLVDPKTNQTFVFRDQSSLMFIPVRYWTYILVALALLSFVLVMSGQLPAPRASAKAAILAIDHALL
jgi:hypothetical protein